MSLKRSLNAKVIVTVIGPSTRMILEENNVFVDVMPDIYKMGPMTCVYHTSLRVLQNT